MPEASMYEHCGTVTWKDEVWSAWHSPHVKAVTKAGSEKAPPQGQFRHGILTANPGHHPAANLTGHDVSHEH